MAQPNKGTHGKPHVSQPIHGGTNSKGSDWDKIKYGAPGGKGTKGSGTGTKK